MPKILYESEYHDPVTRIPGLTIKQNDKNKFIVASLYFFADPTKRSKEWRDEAFAGMTPAGVKKEYFLDYEAMAGTQMFPEFTKHEESIIIAPFEMLPGEYTFWGGFDYGTRNINPSSFHVYAIRKGDELQTVYCIYEIYEACTNVGELALKIKNCPYYPYLQYIAADPHLWAGTQQVKNGNPTSIFQLFVDEGIHNMIPGVTDEQSWVATIHKHWMADPITFKIFANCPMILDEFRKAIYADPKTADPNMLYTDKMANRHNHAMDDNKYFFNSLPNSEFAQRSKVKWPIMVNKWKR